MLSLLFAILGAPASHEQIQYYQPGCDELERAMNRAAHKELKRFAALLRQYDAQTGSGTTQGARLRQVSPP